MAAGLVIDEAVETLSTAVQEAYARNEKTVTVETYLLMALLAGHASLLMANGLFSQRERNRQDDGR